MSTFSNEQRSLIDRQNKMLKGDLISSQSKEQEEGLQTLHDSLTRIKSIGLTFGDELDVQKGLLTNLQKDVNKTKEVCFEFII
jgi:hypothetical protein